jgi:hypothetical protein
VLNLTVRIETAKPHTNYSFRNVNTEQRMLQIIYCFVFSESVSAVVFGVSEGRTVTTSVVVPFVTRSLTSSVMVERVYSS